MEVEGKEKEGIINDGIWIGFGWEVMMVDDYIGESTTSWVSGDYSGWRNGMGGMEVGYIPMKLGL